MSKNTIHKDQYAPSERSTETALQEAVSLIETQLQAIEKTCQGVLILDTN